MVFITKLTGLGIMDGSKTCIMKKNIIIESKFKTRCFQEIVGTYSNSRNTIEHFQLRATLKHDFLFSPVSICNSLKTMVGLTMERPELPKFKTMQRALTAQRDKGWFLDKSFSF